MSFLKEVNRVYFTALASSYQATGEWMEDLFKKPTQVVEKIRDRVKIEQTLTPQEPYSHPGTSDNLFGE